MNENEARKITLSKELHLLFGFLSIYAMGLLVYLFHKNIGTGKLPNAPPWSRINFMVPYADCSAILDPDKKS
jgi:Ni/Fe-hydrogenase subunit HybB-like protein